MKRFAPRKPEEPKNKIVEKRIEIEGSSLNELIEIAKKFNLDFNKCWIKNYWISYEDADLVLSYNDLEWTEEQFKVEMERYEEALAYYKEWEEEGRLEKLEEANSKLEKLKKEQEEMKKKIAELSKRS